MEFKIGDKVRLIKKENWCDGLTIGDIYTVSETGSGIRIKEQPRLANMSAPGYWISEDCFKLVNQGYFNKSKFTSGEITSQYYTLPSDFYMGAVIDWGLNKPKKTIMNTLTAKIKRIFSPSLQTQYKAGLIDNCGELTSRGREEVDMLVRDLIDEKLTKRAKEIIAEEKEDK